MNKSDNNNVKTEQPGSEIKENEPGNFEQKFFTAMNILSFISLSFVVFGILTIGFIVAPVVFKNHIPREVASDIMSNVFLRYYPLAFTLVLVSVGVELIRLFLKTKEVIKSKLLILQFLLIMIVASLTAYSNFVLLPRINEMRLTEKGPTLWTNEEFTILHKRSEEHAKLIFMLGLIPLCFMVGRKN
jgi:hypothetical protein